MGDDEKCSCLAHNYGDHLVCTKCMKPTGNQPLNGKLVLVSDNDDTEAYWMVACTCGTKYSFVCEDCYACKLPNLPEMKKALINYFPRCICAIIDGYSKQLQGKGERLKLLPNMYGEFVITENQCLYRIVNEHCVEKYTLPSDTKPCKKFKFDEHLQDISILSKDHIFVRTDKGLILIKNDIPLKKEFEKYTSFLKPYVLSSDLILIIYSTYFSPAYNKNCEIWNITTNIIVHSFYIYSSSIFFVIPIFPTVFVMLYRDAVCNDHVISINRFKKTKWIQTSLTMYHTSWPFKKSDEELFSTYYYKVDYPKLWIGFYRIHHTEIDFYRVVNLKTKAICKVPCFTPTIPQSFDRYRLENIFITMHADKEFCIGIDRQKDGIVLIKPKANHTLFDLHSTDIKHQKISLEYIFSDTQFLFLVNNYLYLGTVDENNCLTSRCICLYNGACRHFLYFDNGAPVLLSISVYESVFTSIR